jgi:DNA polymerase-3 subunit gamma/tau
MSYVTKYRPSSFDKVIGQDAIVSSLKSSIEKKAAKVYLFEGPTGTGKTTLARICAAMIGCQSKDIQEIDAATFTGIDDMREITKGLMYRPIGGEVKALILDEAHALSKQAWDSLLKALEDPPAHVYWFLCTTNAARVPATVMTRCARYQLKPVAKNDLIDLLGTVADAENILPGKTGDAIIALCAAEAGGSPRQALSNLALCANAKDRGEASDLMASAVDSVEAIELAKALLTGTTWAKARVFLEGLKAAGANGESVRQVVRAYITAVAVGSQKEEAAHRCMAILDAFKDPCGPGEQLTPIVLAVGRLLFSD